MLTSSYSEKNYRLCMFSQKIGYYEIIIFYNYADIKL